LKKTKNHSELKASFNTIRVGMRYKMVNYGEAYIFDVLEIISDNNCLVKSVDTLETFYLEDIVKFGKGDDFEFDEL
jgi:hypothetical protein